MLEPHGRTLLLDALRPPEGYRVDHAIGTTFSLDLDALIAVPLAFTAYEAHAADGEVTADPLVVLQGLRRHADSLTVFCQAGQAVVPRRYKPPFAWLEDVVVEVALRRGAGVFHPKVWVIRFVAEDKTVRYRVLCLSRNLTFDRSWDTALVLEGVLTDRRNAYSVNYPLVTFIAGLPNLATRGLSAERRDVVEQMADEVNRVKFDVPSGFEMFRFWALGSGSKRWPFLKGGQRLLVVSPFLSPELLPRLAGGRQGCILISRDNVLQVVGSKGLEPFERVYAWRPDLTTDDDTSGADGSEEGQPVSAISQDSGLHTKLYVLDHGWNAHVWTGSANATNAAFSHNIEFLVELVGKKSVCGIDALLQSGEDGTKFADLLQPLTHLEPPSAVDAVKRRLEKALREARRALAGAPLRLQAASVEKGLVLSLVCDGELDIRLFGEVSAWPIALSKADAQPLRPGISLPRFSISQQALTSFMAFEVTVRAGDRRESASFVLNLPLEGAPVDRREQLLLGMLATQQDLIRFILMLLGDETEGFSSLAAGDSSGTPLDGLLTGPGQGMFEALLHALARCPDKLDEVSRLIDDVHRTDAGSTLLPPGFDEIWQPISEAHRRRRDRKAEK